MQDCVVCFCYWSKTQTTLFDDDCCSLWSNRNVTKKHWNCHHLSMNAKESPDVPPRSCTSAWVAWTMITVLLYCFTAFLRFILPRCKWNSCFVIETNHMQYRWALQWPFPASADHLIAMYFYLMIMFSKKKKNKSSLLYVQCACIKSVFLIFIRKEGKKKGWHISASLKVHHSQLPKIPNWMCKKKKKIKKKITKTLSTQFPFWVVFVCVLSELLCTECVHF